VTAADAATVVATPSATRGQRAGELGRALLRSRTFMVGAVVLAFWVLDAIFWPAIVPHDPSSTGTDILVGPSGDHLLGTDNLGRDVFSRVLAGARSVLIVAPLATLIGLIGGTTIGLVSGYHRGIVDTSSAASSTRSSPSRRS